MLATLNSKQIVDEIVKDTMKDNDPHDAIQISPDVLLASRAVKDAPTLAPEITPRMEPKVSATADARAAAWECIVIESTSNGPITRSALAEVHAAGATVITPDPSEIQATLATVDDRCWRRMRRPEADQRPLLLVVGDGDHIPNDVLERIVYLGRAADVHLAIDERARSRTSRRFDANVLGVYRGSGQRSSMSDDNWVSPRWSDPIMTSDDPHSPRYVGDPSGTHWTVELGRADGEHARILLYDSGDGGLVVILSGSAGADIEVNEGGSSTAPLAVSLRMLSPAGSDWRNDRNRVTDALAATGEAWTTDPFKENTDVHYRADGAHILTEYAAYTGRLVYATVRRPGQDPRRVLGAKKVEMLLDAIASLDESDGAQWFGACDRI